MSDKDDYIKRLTRIEDQLNQIIKHLANTSSKDYMSVAVKADTIASYACSKCGRKY